MQQVDEAIPLLVAQDKNPAFHKVVSGLKAVHPPRNPQGLRVQPANLTKPKQDAAPVQQVSPPSPVPPSPSLPPRDLPPCIILELACMHDAMQAGKHDISVTLAAAAALGCPHAQKPFPRS